MKLRTCSLAGMMLVALALGVNANPLIPFGVDCKNPAVRKEMIAKIVTSSQQLASSIEGVPPDVAAYIIRERKASLEQNNPERFNRLIANSSYYAFVVHEAADKVRSDLRAAVEANSMPKQISNVANALSQAGNLQQYLSDYITADGRRGRSVLKDKDIGQLTFRIGADKYNMVRLIECIATAITKSQ